MGGGGVQITVPGKVLLNSESSYYYKEKDVFLIIANKSGTIARTKPALNTNKKHRRRQGQPSKRTDDPFAHLDNFLLLADIFEHPGSLAA